MNLWITQAGICEVFRAPFKLYIAPCMISVGDSMSTEPRQHAKLMVQVKGDPKGRELYLFIPNQMVRESNIISFARSCVNMISEVVRDGVERELLDAYVDFEDILMKTAKTFVK